VRLGSFNLLSGRSLSDGRIERQRLIDAAIGLDADVLAVQEVDRRQPRSSSVDQTAVLAQALGADHARFVPTVDGTPGEPGWTPGDDVREGPQYGISLISRIPVAEWHVLRLSPARGRFPLLIPSRPPRVLWLNDEPRAVIAAVLAEPRITIACTHLSFVPLVNVRQLRQVRRWLATLPGPTVLMGDFNLPSGPARRLTGWTPLVSAPTFPSPAPRIQLDHVLAAGLPLGSRARGRAVRAPISDHRPLVVDLDLGNH